MAENRIYSATTPMPVSNVRLGSGVSANTGEVMSFTLVDGTADPGAAAGTIVYGKTALSPILNALCDRSGQFFSDPLHTSVAFTDGVIVAAQEVGFIYDGTKNERLEKTAALLLNDGDFAVDYETGLFVIRKATADTSLTLDYCSPTGITGAGGPASDVNVTQFGGSNVTLGQTTMLGSMPVTIASDQSSVPVTTGANTVMLDGTDTIAATGVAQQIIVASTPCLTAIVQNLSNTETLTVGNATSQSFVLFPYDSRAIPIDDLNKVYVVGTAGESFAFGGTV